MTILQRIARQPAKLLAAIQALIGLGLILGLFKADNIDAITGGVLLALSAVLAAISEYVTPVNDPNLPIGTAVNLNSSGQTGVVVPATVTADGGVVATGDSVVVPAKITGGTVTPQDQP